MPARPTRRFDEQCSHLLTRYVGLSQYRSEIRIAAATTYLAIERFDRVVAGENVSPRRQEDRAQALGPDWRETDVKFQEPRS